MRKVLIIILLINWVANAACVNFGIHRTKTNLNTVDTFYTEFDEYKCADSNVIHIVDSMRSDSKRYFGNEANIFYYASFFQQDKGMIMFELISTTCYHVVDTSRTDNIVNTNSGIVVFGNSYLVVNAYTQSNTRYPDSSLYYFRKYFKKTPRRINAQFLKHKQETDCTGEKLSFAKNYVIINDSIQLLSLDSSKLADYRHK